MKWDDELPDVDYNGGYAIGLSEFAKIVAEFAISNKINSKVLSFGVFFISDKGQPPESFFV